nr:hypothetical protein Iba_chr14bCG0800 [Ipomoea batatas]
MVEMASMATGFILGTDDSSTRPGARRLSLSLLAEEGDDEVGDVRDVGPTMRSDSTGPPSVREARRRCSARANKPEANPFWDLLNGSGSSTGCRRLTDLAPLTVTIAPSANTTFFTLPASTSCCILLRNQNQSARQGTGQQHSMHLVL